MTRKGHNHRLLTDPLHLKEGTRNIDTCIYNIHVIKMKSSALFLVKMITTLETYKKTKTQYKTPTINRNNNKQSFQHPYIISESLRYFIVIESDLMEQTFTILYIVMSVNRFDTKFWLLLNSLLDFFVQLKEKYVQISIVVLGFQAQLYTENS